jgi:hypothetical protein
VCVFCLQEREKEAGLYEDRIEELQKLHEMELHAKRMLETQLVQDKREHDMRHREALAQVLLDYTFV